MASPSEADNGPGRQRKNKGRRVCSMFVRSEISHLLCSRYYCFFVTVKYLRNLPAQEPSMLRSTFYHKAQVAYNARVSKRKT